MIEQLFTDYWPVIMVIAGMIWWAASTHGKVNGLADDVKDIKTQVGVINTQISDINTQVGVLNTQISGILNVVTNNNVSQSQSPAQLNEYGTQISNKINGGEFVKKHLDAVHFSEDMSKYQMQQACFDYAQAELMDKISAEERERLEGVAYTEGAAIPIVLAVLGFELRNAKFKSLGIDIAGAGNSTSEN
ncbi:MAG: hypothetical protein ACNYPD_01380 [Candidatus Halichondribacter symbioticus]